MGRIINIGIIGAGIVAERIIKAIERSGRGRVIGVYDTNNSRLEYIVNTYNIPTVDNYNVLLENKDIDLIYLAVPPKYHYPISMDIISAKKHLLCEKPLANSTKEAREMYEAAEEKGILHAMNFPTVYTSSFLKLESLIREGHIGNLRRIELHGYFKQWPRAWQQTEWIASKEQGGFVREIFTHFVQMIQRMFGEITNINSIIEEGQDPLAAEVGLIATASLVGGVPVLLNGFSNIGIEDNLSLNIYGTEGMLSLVNWRELWTSNKEVTRKKLDVAENDHLVELLGEVFNAVDGKNSNLVTFKEGYKAQLVIEKLLGRE